MHRLKPVWLFVMLPAFGLLTTAVSLPKSVGQEATTAKERMLRDIKYLASDELEGRGTQTKGINKAADFIAEQFKKAGLKPGGTNGYFQPFTFSTSSKLQNNNKLVLHGPQGQIIELKHGKHFQVMGLSAGGEVTAPVVFAGYGITAPNVKYNDFKDLDVQNKVVIVIRKTPLWGHKTLKFDGDNQRTHATFSNKIANAEIHKAAAVLLVNDKAETGNNDRLLAYKELARESGSGIPAIQIKRTVVDDILRSALQTSLLDMEKAIDRDLTPRSQALEGWTVTLKADVKRTETSVKNVVGVLPGAGPLAKEYVVVGAHYDHLGFGEKGSLANNKADRKKIHNGADDNASGTTAVLELARRYGAKKNRQGRTMVFMAFSAEEKGLLGSRFYCNRQPLYALKDTAVMVNLDMVGRMQKDTKSKKGKLNVQGVGTGKGFEKLVDTINKEYDFKLIKRKGGTGPSDHASFFSKDIPVLFVWTGVHKDYHKPSDDWQNINLEDMIKITDLVEDVLSHLTTQEKRPQFVRVSGGTKVSGVGNIPRMGFQPGYGEEVKGVLVEAVSDKSPAKKAGMKAGDVIVEIGGRPVSNLTTYMAAMRLQKRGRETPVTVLRNKKKLQLKVTPQ